MSHGDGAQLLPGRRPFLTGGALGLIGALMADQANAQTPASQPRVIGFNHDENANVKLVKEFCATWSTKDLKKVTAFLTDQSVSRITMDLRPLTGPKGVIEEMAQWMESSSSIDFNILECFACGPLVVTHRIDTFASKTRPVTWEGVGVFRIDNGKIVEWSDYSIKITIPPTAA
jgi:limonene-1,2-epoxide hydrolase